MNERVSEQVSVFIQCAWDCCDGCGLSSEAIINVAYCKVHNSDAEFWMRIFYEKNIIVIIMYSNQ